MDCGRECRNIMDELKMVAGFLVAKVLSTKWAA